MTASNDDRWDRDREQTPPPRDELDELLREWHRRSAQHAAEVKERLLGELVTKRRSARRPFAPMLDTAPWRPIWDYFATHHLPRIAAPLVLVAGVAVILLTPGWPFGERGAVSASDITPFGLAPAMPGPGIMPICDEDGSPMLVSYAGMWTGFERDKLKEPRASARADLSTGKFLDKFESYFRDAGNAVEEAGKRLADTRDTDGRYVVDPWIPWTRLYRTLAAVGRWDEAIDEAREFLEYAKGQDELSERYSMYYTALSDLGNIYVALGDYARALTLYERSLARARDYLEWFHRPGHSPDPRPHALDLDLAASLTPRFWMLSTLHAAQGDTQQAWDYLNEAEECLTIFFAKECTARRLNVALDASLVELCLAVVADGDEGLGSPVAKAREHLLYRTRLLRIGGDLTSAAQTLELASTLPPRPFADESRLDFNEPMERLRLAIAGGYFAAALDAAAEAGRHLGPRHFDGELLSHPPIGLLARAELQFFHGLARAALDPKDPEALNLIESAIKVVDQSATSLPQQQRERLLYRFSEWKQIAEQLR